MPVPKKAAKSRAVSRKTTSNEMHKALDTTDDAIHALAAFAADIDADSQQVESTTGCEAISLPPPPPELSDRMGAEVYLSTESHDVPAEIQTAHRSDHESGGDDSKGCESNGHAQLDGQGSGNCRSPNSPDTIVVADLDREVSTSTIRVCGREDDLKVAENIAKIRGLPPSLEPEAVKDFLANYGYDVVDAGHWMRTSENQPSIAISVVDHIQFGDHTQYEVQCRVVPSQGSSAGELSWRTLRRLKHIRSGIHDPVREALGSQYKLHFDTTPFAHHMAPAGTTARLRGWFRSLAHSINSGSLQPLLVAQVLRVLDGPGTPLLAEGKDKCTSEELDQVPITAAMFGSKQADHSQLPRLGLISRSQVTTSAIKLGSRTECLSLGFDDGGEDRSIKMYRRPFGVEFGRTQAGAAKVAKVQPQSYAEQLGVEVGWVVKSVDGEDVSNKEFHQVQACVKNAVIRLPEQRNPGE